MSVDMSCSRVYEANPTPLDIFIQLRAHNVKDIFPGCSIHPTNFERRTPPTAEKCVSSHQLEPWSTISFMQQYICLVKSALLWNKFRTVTGRDLSWIDEESEKAPSQRAAYVHRHRPLQKMITVQCHASRHLRVLFLVLQLSETIITPALTTLGAVYKKAFSHWLVSKPVNLWGWRA